MQDIPRWLEFWGKARAENELGPSWHPIAHHLLDVAAVTEALLGARSLVVRRVARRMRDPRLSDPRRRFGSPVP